MEINVSFFPSRVFNNSRTFILAKIIAGNKVIVSLSETFSLRSDLSREALPDSRILRVA